MKNLGTSILLVLTLLFVSSSCQYSNKMFDPNPESLVLNSKKSVQSLNLDTKFNLSKEVYDEFIESVTFENGAFGAIYTGVEKELSDKSSDEFWSNFGISIRGERSSKNGRTENEVHMGYMPKMDGCVRRRRWICVIRL